MQTENKISTPQQALEKINVWKSEGVPIIFTNGCFDILHVGHVDYLQKAKNIGGKLVIGVNTDKSVRRIKGDNRPIVDENARMRVLASLEFVDCVTWFEEDTPLELISCLLPDVLVKGNDYSIDNIVGADIVMEHGGRVDTISLVEGYSTSNIVDKIIKIKQG
ncbi:D-glycero-beta-D-manno-heptose 1-phosphate adenylyltransferase [Reichenbachiella sp. MALMAid0571]|uniref:D-glycero-beta-D-manno-heptose 1-phosphate adenylyltransferase n=1 Tax=Reichenbachiella sp. MALMAid0571 TaxID=3143939 RepID=UPI0032DF85FE